VSFSFVFFWQILQMLNVPTVSPYPSGFSFLFETLQLEVFASCPELS
jgi:hypothetical protein